eukprot:scaffold1504_cov417-Prasinococcus_capsulatus_cf.AAC.59
MACAQYYDYLKGPLYTVGSFSLFIALLLVRPCRDKGELAQTADAGHGPLSDRPLENDSFISKLRLRPAWSTASSNHMSRAGSRAVAFCNAAFRVWRA